MGKDANRLLDIEKINQYILIGLVLISLVLAVLFWQNPVTVYDASGHVTLIRSADFDSWPSFSGWDSRELLGWPQGLFYPSFFHWLAAGLSFLVGVPAAVKLLISAALVALPFSLAAFSKSLTENKVGLAITTLVLFILILIFPNFLGTGVRTLFQIGLLSNFFVLPIFFFFLASLDKTENYLFSAILLSLTIITHIVAAIVAVLYLVLFIARKFLMGEKQKIFKGLKLAGLAAILTAFFWLPFIVNLPYTSVSRHVSSYLLPNVFVLAILLFLVIVALRKKDTNILTLSLLAGFFISFATIDALLIRNSGTSFALYPFHIYRFQPFGYLFTISAACLFLLGWPRFRFLTEKKLMLAIIFVAGFGLILLILFLKNPAKLPQARFEVKNPEIVSGRFLETFRRREVEPFWYGPQTGLLEKNPKAAWAYGLFTDSTPNGPYLGSLIRSLNRGSYPEGEEAFIETKFVDEQRLGELLNLFGINYLIHLGGEQKNPIGVFEKEGKTEFFNAEKVSDSSLFEVVKLSLEPVEADWNKKVESWWLEEGPLTKLPYLVKGEELVAVSTKEVEEAQVKVLSTNEKQTRFELEITTEKKVPILAKISYFPYWHAFDQNGKEIRIYRAAPNLMLLEANGKVTLEYQEPTWVRGLYLVSAASFLIIIFRLAKKI